MHHYTQRGFTLDYLLGLGVEERMFYIASMEKALEEQRRYFSYKGVIE